jgi:predicted ATPase/DNA-binding CsgD family transcriptional regulator
LPEAVTSFVGRRAELAAARSRMAQSRLVTLIGAGGVGKTRLALRVAADVRKAFRDGVWLVDLAPLGDGSRVPEAVLSALMVRDQSARHSDDKLVDHLRGRQLLIVLDNCEHLLPACAVLTDRVLRSAPGVRVLATSREPLGIDGEYLLAVPPLSAPEVGRPRPVRALAQYEAVHLLIDRARGVRPDFAVTEENHHAVAQLCAWLDGIPLAIELAATRLRSLSVTEVVARLDDRFGFLTEGSRAAQPRQQTLRAMINWSYELCTAEEQLLWARLSVFAGSFDLAAVEGVCAGGLLRARALVGVIDHLVAKSILTAEPHGERVRYRMLMTVREFGAELLDAELPGPDQPGPSGECPHPEGDRMRRAHRDYYLARARRMAEGWCGPGQAVALAQMRADHANLTAALQWTLRRPGEESTAAAFAAALRHHWVAGGSLGEGRRWLDQVLDTAVEPGAERAEALWVAAWVCLVQGDGPAAARRLDECAALSDGLANEQLQAHAAHQSALAALFAGELPRAVELYDRAIPILTRAGNTGAVLTAQFQLAIGLTYQGAVDRAEQICRSAIWVADEHQERWARAYAKWAYGVLRFRQGAADEAEGLAREALTSQRDFHDGICVALSIELLAWIAAGRADAMRSARLLGAARAVWSEIGTSMSSFGPYMNGDSDTAARAAMRELGASRFAAALDEGRAVDLSRAVEFALAGASGRAEAAVSDPRQPALSRRETEVARLIARGLSNRAIAESLVLSPRTVDGHVERILTKLGFASRVQVAGWISAHLPDSGASGENR